VAPRRPSKGNVKDEDVEEAMKVKPASMQRRASSKLRTLPITQRMQLVLPRIGLATDDQLQHLAEVFPEGGSKAMQALLNLMASGVEDGVIWSQDSWRGDSMGSVTGHSGDKLDLHEPIPMPPTAGCNLLHTEGTLEVMLNQLTYSVAKITNDSLKRGGSLEELAANAPRQVCALIQRVRFTQDVDKCILQVAKFSTLIDSYAKEKKVLGAKLLDTKISDGERAALSVLLIVLFEQMSLLEKLKEKKTAEEHAELWKEQMRFYHDTEEGFVEVRTADKKVEIGNEYRPPTMLITTEFTHNLRWAYLSTMCEGGSRLLALVGPTGSGKTAMLQNVGELLGMLPTTIRATEEMPADEAFWSRMFKAAQSASGGMLAPVIIAQAQRVPEGALDIALSVASKMEVALCLTMVPGAAAKALQEGILAGCTVITVPESDLKTIAGGALSAKGLEKSEELAEPLSSILESLTKECSKQSHYDFGPRTLDQLCTQIGVGRSKTAPEQDIVRDVMIRCLLPRLVNEDVPKLQKLLTDSPSLAFDKELSAPSSSTAGRWPTVVANILSITKVEPDCMVLPFTASDEEAFYSVFCKELNRLGHTLVKVDQKLSDLSVEELMGAMPKKGEPVKDGLLVSVLRKAMEDHPPELGNMQVWVYIETGACSPEKWEGLFELQSDSGCLNLTTGEQLRLAENLRFLFVLPDAGDTPSDTFSRSSVVWTDPPAEA